MSALPASAAMRSSSGCSGAMPAASILASSMPAAKKSPTFCSIVPVSQVPAAAALASSCWTWSERSPRAAKAPQTVRSPGTGLAASHFEFTKPLKSWQAWMLVSRSAACSEIGCWATLVRSMVSFGASGAAAVSAGASACWQAARATVIERARASGRRVMAGSGAGEVAEVRGFAGVGVGHWSWGPAFLLSPCGRGWERGALLLLPRLRGGWEGVLRRSRRRDKARYLGWAITGRFFGRDKR